MTVWTAIGVALSKLSGMSIPNGITKAQATGNDFVMYFDADGTLEPTADETRWLCDRHFGIGADGLLRLTRPQYVGDLEKDRADAFGRSGVSWFMDYRNADGSLAEMCGNGTRAITLFAERLGLLHDDMAGFTLGTRAGVKTIRRVKDHAELGDDVFTVDMGRFSRDESAAYQVSIPGVEGRARGAFVDMGNPHIVVLDHAGLPAVRDLDLSKPPVILPSLQHGQNVEFVEVGEISPASDTGTAFMRVNERGVGETLSCGTGLCATAVTLQARTGIHHWHIDVLGGRVDVDVDERLSTVRLTGPAVIVGVMSVDASAQVRKSPRRL